MKAFIPLFFFVLSFQWTGAQAPVVAKKQLQAARASHAIQIDGALTEAAWLAVSPGTDFITLEPVPGEPSSQKTEVRVIYDNSGIYVGAICWDTEPGDIKKELTQRDQFGNTDWFGAFIDSYQDGLNAIGFIVTPAGVQFDAKYSVFGEDTGWDAVWESAAAITPTGWIAEIKIPYSAIRFPKTDTQTWHINFGRQIQRLQQKSFWSPIDPKIDGFINQSGLLTGIQGIKSPFRLQATPFLAVYGEHYRDKNAQKVNSFGRSFNGGMDVKYGINDAFTLDMTLVPDFGEAQSDNQVLNLSPFEVRFDENRQFFTEGTELFNKGDLFYSRRIGGQPFYYSRPYQNLAPDERVVDNPQQAQLVNATKISGRNKKGLGLGFFNATAARMHARIEDGDGGFREVETNPLTNYNVLVLDQNLKNNSYFTLINTTVLRSGEAYDANSSGLVFDLRPKGNKVSFSGSGKLSQKYQPGNTDLGHSYTLGVRKISGTLNYGLTYNVESDTYDPNDLGFLFSNNERSLAAQVNYQIVKPFWKFNRANFGFNGIYNRLYQPDVFTGLEMESWVWGQLKNFWEVNAWVFAEPAGINDYFEPRQPGRFYKAPAIYGTGFWIGSDERKRLRVTLNGNLNKSDEEGRWRWALNFGPRYRVNDKLNFQFRIFSNNSFNNVGFADTYVHSVENPQTGLLEEVSDIIFGYRDVINVENTFNINYTFNSAMALSFRMRHNWTKVGYRGFHVLEESGALGPTDYTGNHDTNFNAFNIDMVYRWRFAPGSDLYLVWKNAILDAENRSGVDYFDNLGGLFDQPQSNSLSLKVIYFLDYASMMKKTVKG